MEETREEKLRRWLEEKKAAKRAAADSSSRPADGPSGSSTVKRSRQTTAAAPPSATPKGSASSFARFEQQTPVGRTSRPELKTPQQQQQRQNPSSELKTPVQQRTDSLTSNESLDRRRRVLERSTLVSGSVRKEPLHSHRKDVSTTARKEVRPPAPAVVAPAQTPTGSARKAVGDGSASAQRRRREALMAPLVEVDVHDLQMLRDHLALVETVLLQWSFLNIRLQRALERQRESAREQLLRVWGDINVARSEALTVSMEVVRERSARMLNTQLDAQYRHLLPLEERVRCFVDHYAGLWKSVYATTHHLPAAPGSVVDMARVRAELSALDAQLGEVLGSQGVHAMLEYARSVAAVSELAQAEFDVLQQCKGLVGGVEKRLLHKRSILVQLRQQMQQQQSAMHG